MQNETKTNKFTVDYAVANFSGHGHYKVTVTLSDENGQVKEFKHTTTNMQAIDDSAELEGQEKYDLLFDTIENYISDEIEEWLRS